MNLKEEIESRKTFAIISHPDAGKLGQLKGKRRVNLQQVIG